MKDEHGLDKVEYFAPPSKVARTKDRNIANKFLMLGLIFLFVILIFILFVYPGYFINVLNSLGSAFVN